MMYMLSVIENLGIGKRVHNENATFYHLQALNILDPPLPINVFFTLCKVFYIYSFYSV